MNAQARHGQVLIGPLVASLGAVVLVVSLFLDWYDDVSAFTVFEFNDLLLLLLGVATIASLAAAIGPTPGVSPAALLAVALVALFVVVSQILNDPPAVSGPAGPGHAIGIWLALAGSALMVAGALLGYAQISLAVEARPRERPSPPPTDTPERP
jgi:hypothetical protein